MVSRRFRLGVQVAVFVGIALGGLVMHGKGEEAASPEEPISWGEVREGFRVGVHGGDTQVFSVKEPILIRVTLENASDAQRRVIRTRPRAEDDWEISALDESGNDVPLTQYGDALFNEPSAMISFTILTVEPGGTWKMEFHLNRMFDMTRRGTYHVRLSRRVFRAAGNAFTTTESQPISITVNDP